MAKSKQGPGRRPDYNVSAMDKEKNHLKGNVGVAWRQENGSIQIKLNSFIILDTTKHDILITLFPYGQFLGAKIAEDETPKKDGEEIPY